jgi:hypothetical protein
MRFHAVRLISSALCRAPALAAWCLALVLVAPALAFAIWDHAVWPWDQAWYGEVSVDLWWTLCNQPAEWLSAMLRAFGTKPPAVAWLGQFFIPIGQALGSVEAGLLVMQVLVAVIVLVWAFDIGRSVEGGGYDAATFSALMLASAPLFMGMTTQMFPELIQTASVMLIYWVAICTDPAKLGRVVCVLVIALCVGFLAKLSTPLYVVAPISILAMRVAKAWPNTCSGWRKQFEIQPALLFGSLMCVIACAAWYLSNINATLHHLALATSGDVALNYGNYPSVVPKLQFWSSAAQQSFFGGYAGMVMILMLVIIAVGALVRCTRKSFYDLFPTVTVLALLIQIVIVGVALGAQTNEETRYLLPLLPSVVYLCVLLYTNLSHRIMRYIMLLGAVVLYVQTAGAVLGYSKSPYRVSGWLKSIEKNPSQRNAIERAVWLTSNAASNNKTQIVGCEEPWLNANTVSFYSSKQKLATGFKALYTSLGYAERDEKIAWSRFQRISPQYFITLDRAADYVPNYLNMIASPTRLRVAQSDDYELKATDKSAGIEIYTKIDTK